ncbi:hypothetical protein ACWGB8_33225 [Kitasatospora sp. NPDC054939]
MALASLAAPPLSRRPGPPGAVPAAAEVRAWRPERRWLVTMPTFSGGVRGTQSFVVPAGSAQEAVDAAALRASAAGPRRHRRGARIDPGAADAVPCD